MQHATVWFRLASRHVVPLVTFQVLCFALNSIIIIILQKPDNNEKQKKNEYFRENGCPWDETTCASAAIDGHLSILQWLRHKGCPWDSTTCSAAAGRGQLDVLEWARANG